MFYVVVLHCIGRGGVLGNLTPNTLKYNCVLFIKIFTFCAVDIFALISGYVLYTDEHKKIKLSNYFNIWLQVVYYGILVTIFFHIFKIVPISKDNYFLVLFPVTNDLYWYFTAYSGMYLFIPYINKLIRNCNEFQLKKLLIIIILIFSIHSMIFNGFFLNFGYSLLWITLVYIIGAIIKKCKIGENFKNYQIIFGIMILCVITYLNSIYGIEQELMNIKITKDMFFSYTSPTILFISILYLILFKRIQFSNGFKKVIGIIAPSAFIIYILNNHKLVWDYILNNMFVEIANDSIIKTFICIFGFSILFVIGTLLIDRIRILLFKLLKICEKLEVLSIKIENLFNKIIRNL